MADAPQKLEVNKLTLGEIALIEQLTRMPITQIGEDESPKGNMLAALALIAKRRNGEPKYTWNEAQGLTMDEANDICGFTGDEDEDDDEDPTEE